MFTPRHVFTGKKHQDKFSSAGARDAEDIDSMPKRALDQAMDLTNTKVGEFVIEAKIGEGTHGVVYKAKASGDHAVDVAIKQMKPTRGNDGISITALREIALVRELSHPNIVVMLDVVMTSSEDGAGRRILNLVFEYVGSDLAQRMKAAHCSGQFFEQATIRSIMQQTLTGLTYLHAAFAMHRDIKPANLLVSDAGSVKITDFGLSRLFDRPLRPVGMDGPVVTPWYRPPELLLGAKTHTATVDCWSAGCVLGELYTLQPLFPARENVEEDLQREQLLTVVRNLGAPTVDSWPNVRQLRHWRAFEGALLSLPPAAHVSLEERFVAECPAGGPKPSVLAWDLLHGLLTLCPEGRFSAAAAAAHPFFSERSRD